MEDRKPTEEENELYRQAGKGILEHTEEGYRNAIRSYEQLLKIDPNHITLWSLIGGVYESLKEYEQQYFCYQTFKEKTTQGIGDLENNIGSCNSIGKNYFLRGKYKDSVEWFEHTLKLAKTLEKPNLSSIKNRLEQARMSYHVENCIEKIRGMESSTDNSKLIMFVESQLIKFAKLCVEQDKRHRVRSLKKLMISFEELNPNNSQEFIYYLGSLYSMSCDYDKIIDMFIGIEWSDDLKDKAITALDDEIIKKRLNKFTVAMSMI